MAGLVDMESGLGVVLLADAKRALPPLPPPPPAVARTRAAAVRKRGGGRN